MSSSSLDLLFAGANLLDECADGVQPGRALLPAQRRRTSSEATRDQHELRDAERRRLDDAGAGSYATRGDERHRASPYLRHTAPEPSTTSPASVSTVNVSLTVKDPAGQSFTFVDSATLRVDE